MGHSLTALLDVSLRYNLLITCSSVTTLFPVILTAIYVEVLEDGSLRSREVESNGGRSYNLFLVHVLLTPTSQKVTVEVTAQSSKADSPTPCKG